MPKATTKSPKAAKATPAAIEPEKADTEVIAPELAPENVGPEPEGTDVPPAIAFVDPLVGETVLYTLPEDPRFEPRSVGQVRPAIVLRVWSKDCVNLHVLLDGPNDLHHSVADERYRSGHLANLAWATSRNRDLTGRPGTWRPRA